MRSLILLTALALTTSGCTRTHLSVPSPDGTHVARVLSRPSIDPPAQSLWLGPVDGKAAELLRLAPDQDWCNAVSWSADGSTVAFLVQDARVIAFSSSGQLLVDRWLVEHQSYPSREIARAFSLSADGSQASFTPCLRHPGHSSGGSPCSPVRTIAVRASGRAGAA